MTDVSVRLDCLGGCRGVRTAASGIPEKGGLSRLGAKCEEKNATAGWQGWPKMCATDRAHDACHFFSEVSQFRRLRHVLILTQNLMWEKI